MLNIDVAEMLQPHLPHALLPVHFAGDEREETFGAPQRIVPIENHRRKGRKRKTVVSAGGKDHRAMRHVLGGRERIREVRSVERFRRYDREVSREENNAGSIRDQTCQIQVRVWVGRCKRVDLKEVQG